MIRNDASMAGWFVLTKRKQKETPLTRAIDCACFILVCPLPSSWLPGETSQLMERAARAWFGPRPSLRDHWTAFEKSMASAVARSASICFAQAAEDFNRVAALIPATVEPSFEEFMRKVVRDIDNAFGLQNGGRDKS